MNLDSAQSRPGRPSSRFARHCFFYFIQNCSKQLLIWIPDVFWKLRKNMKKKNNSAPKILRKEFYSYGVCRAHFFFGIKFWSISEVIRTIIFDSNLSMAGEVSKTWKKSDYYTGGVAKSVFDIPTEGTENIFLCSKWSMGMRITLFATPPCQ